MAEIILDRQTNKQTTFLNYICRLYGLSIDMCGMLQRDRRFEKTAELVGAPGSEGAFAKFGFSIGSIGDVNYDTYQGNNII